MHQTPFVQLACGSAKRPWPSSKMSFLPVSPLVTLGYVELAAGQAEAALNVMGTPEFAVSPRKYEFRLRS